MVRKVENFRNAVSPVYMCMTSYRYAVMYVNSFHFTSLTAKNIVSKTHVHISLPYTLNKHFRNENPFAKFSISYIFKYNILFLIKFEYFNILSKKNEKDNANSDISTANSLEDISLVIQDISQRIRIINNEIFKLRWFSLSLFSYLNF